MGAEVTAGGAKSGPDRHQPLRLYFAYGSNLAREQMRAPPALEPADRQYRGRCPDSLAVAACQLDGWRLLFVGERTGRWGRGGVATIVPSAGRCVPGAIYRLSPADEQALDGFEGVNPAAPEEGSYRKLESLFSFGGEPVFSYVATARLAPETKPNERYLAALRRGYEQWGLPHEVLNGIGCYPGEPDAQP